MLAPTHVPPSDGQVKHAEILEFIDSKLEEYGPCMEPHQVPRLAQALAALADHPSRHAKSHKRTFTAAFSEILPPDLEGVEPRFERCRDLLLARFAKEPAAGRRKLFEQALNGLAFAVQKPARPLLMKLLELSKGAIALPKRPKGPRSTLTVKYKVEVNFWQRRPGKPDREEDISSGPRLACFDGLAPDGETFLDEIPSLEQSPGRSRPALRLHYHRETETLECWLTMELERPLAEDELTELRDVWLEDFADNYDLPEWEHPKKPPPTSYIINVDRIFNPEETPPAAEILHGGEMARQEYESKKRVQQIHRWLCGSLPVLCGNQVAFVRRPGDGHWRLHGQGSGDGTLVPALVSDGPDRDVDRWPLFGDRAKAFVSALPVDRRCVFLTLVPYRDTRRAEAASVAAALDLRLIEPLVTDLRTVDGSHLDEPSAERWSAAFFETAGQRIHECAN